MTAIRHYAPVSLMATALPVCMLLLSGWVEEWLFSDVGVKVAAALILFVALSATGLPWLRLKGFAPLWPYALGEMLLCVVVVCPALAAAAPEKFHLTLQAGVYVCSPWFLPVNWMQVAVMAVFFSMAGPLFWRLTRHESGREPPALAISDAPTALRRVAFPLVGLYWLILGIVTLQMGSQIVTGLTDFSLDPNLVELPQNADLMCLR